MSSITVVSPLGINRVGSQPLAPRSLDGVTLGILNNNKPNSLELQRRVVELLGKGHPVAGSVTKQKPSAAIGPTGSIPTRRRSARSSLRSATEARARRGVSHAGCGQVSTDCLAGRP